MERLWLLDERHVSRVADDHLPRALDAGAYVLRAYRPADEVLFARDHKRRTRDGGQAAAHVEGREDLIVEELQRVGVDGLGLQRVEVARLRRSEMSEVQRPLPEDELGQLLVGREFPCLFFLEGGDRVRRPRLTGPLVHAFAHRGLLPRTEAGQRRRQDEAPHPPGIARRVRLRHHASVRVAEEEHPLLAQVRPELLEIGHVVIDLVRAPVPGPVRATRTARVEQDQRVLLPERGQVAEVDGREPWPARMADKHRPMSELAVGQLAAVAGGEAHASRGSGRQRPPSSR